MNFLRLIREPSASGATLGSLYFNGVWNCWTLEDEIRQQPGRPVSTWKVHGATAIPSGTYQIDVTMSNRFGRELPILLDVPGFTGIRIHPGNTATDTEGCLLVGRRRSGARVLESRLAMAPLLDLLRARTSVILIEGPMEKGEA